MQLSTYCHHRRNDIQIDGLTHTIMPMEPLHEKWESFGWHVMEVDGSIRSSSQPAARQLITDSKPVCIMPIRFLEKECIYRKLFTWHGKAPMSYKHIKHFELRTMGGRIT
jgi:transketolase